MGIITEYIQLNVGTQSLALIVLGQLENCTLYLFLGLGIRILCILSFRG